MSSSDSTISISDAFDGGNGEYVKTEIIDGTKTVFVKIRPDPYTELEKKNHFQYFSFRATPTVASDDEETIKYVIENAGDASYTVAWDGTTTFYTTTDPNDPISWKRKLDTSYDADTGHLSWSHTHPKNGGGSVYFSYFPPFSYNRHLQLISRCASSRVPCKVSSLGQTLDGREMECITVGKGERQCWIIHRQHPGETMAEFYAEGLLTRLLGLDTNGSIDGLATQLLQEKYTFHIVPNMCPDGAFRGHLRTNAQGQNLNREWCDTGKEGDDDYYEAPTAKRSPEVYYVLKRMDETGVDVFLDVHGDEELPFNFLAGAEGCPNYGPRLEHLQGAFLASYTRTNSDMQIKIGYEPEEPGKGRMNVCSNQIALRYDCLAVTLEMPFKDCMSNPDPEYGWNPCRAKMLGWSVLDALAYVHPYLREEGEFWVNFGKEDAYVRPTENYKD
uniref:Peptidase M14 domain-containing protein n=1 Tax=Helicotheca tamesis TaxID=374047 RepID=A0A7S2HI04_9STRA